MNEFKRRRALAGIPVASITSYSMDMMEQYKQTNEYKKSKEVKENKRKSIIKDMKKKGKVDYQKAYDEAYRNSSSTGPKYKPRLRIR